MELGIWGCSETPAGALGGQSTLRKFLDSKEHLNWLKIDLNVAKIITVVDYKHKLTWMEVHICSVKAKSQAGIILVKDIMAT